MPALAESVAPSPTPPAAVIPAPPVESEIAKMKSKLTAPVAVAEPAKKEVPSEVKTVVPPVKEPEISTPAKPLDEAEEFLKDVTPTSKNRFNELANKRAETLYQEKLKTLKLLTPEIEEKLTLSEKRANALEVELKQSDIERSPEYKQKFIERPKEIRIKLTELAKINDIPEGELFAAIDGGTATRRQLNALLSSIGDMDRADVTDFARELQKIQEDRTKVISDHETALKLLTQKRIDETTAAVQNLVSARSEALEKGILPRWESEYSGVFEGAEGTALKDKVLGNVRHYNGGDLERLEPAHRAEMIACAFMAQPLSKALTASKARIVELEAKLAAEDSGSPGVGGRSATAPAEEKPKGAFERMREEVEGRNQ